MKIRNFISTGIAMALAAFVLPLHAYESPSGDSGWNSNALFVLGDFDGRTTLEGTGDAIRGLPAVETILHSKLRSDQSLVGSERFVAATIAVAVNESHHVIRVVSSVYRKLKPDQNLVGGEHFVATTFAATDDKFLILGKKLLETGVHIQVPSLAIPFSGHS
ncbi:MAG: hypothetical protein ACI9BF_000925 [Candidatus Paceibacteria bacterium]|jgi:hypothetical protein